MAEGSIKVTPLLGAHRSVIDGGDVQSQMGFGTVWGGASRGAPQKLNGWEDEGRGELCFPFARVTPLPTQRREKQKMLFDLGSSPFNTLTLRSPKTLLCAQRIPAAFGLVSWGNKASLQQRGRGHATNEFLTPR